MSYCICRCGRPPFDPNIVDDYYSDEWNAGVPEPSILEYRWWGE
jgi:hypothetical protein